MMFVVLILAATVVLIMRKNRGKSDTFLVGAYLMLAYFIFATINSVGMINTGTDGYWFAWYFSL